MFACPIPPVPHPLMAENEIPAICLCHLHQHPWIMFYFAGTAISVWNGETSTHSKKWTSLGYEFFFTSNHWLILLTRFQH